MNTVTISASKKYDIHIGRNLLPTIGTEAKKLGKAEKVCIVSDTQYFPSMAPRQRIACGKQGLPSAALFFPPVKRAKTVIPIWNC